MDKVKISVGDICQIEIDNVKYASAIRGYSVPEYIAFDIPIVNRRYVVIPHNAIFIVRLLSDGMVHGFETGLKKAYTKPISVWMAEYPDSFQSINLRKSKRVSTFLPARLSSGSSVSEGALIDLSEGGGLFVCKKTSLKHNDKCVITTTMPSGEMVDKLPCVVRSVKTRKDENQIGLKFEDNGSRSYSYLNKFYDACSLIW